VQPHVVDIFAEVAGSEVCSWKIVVEMSIYHRAMIGRVLSAVEIVALGVWCGAQVGFAFLFAPIAFRVLGDPVRFNALVTPVFAAIAGLGYVCGTVAVLTALARMRREKRTAVFIRVGLIVVALVLLTYHTQVIVPALTSIHDLTSPAFHAMHDRSRTIYGEVLLLALTALIMIPFSVESR